jgi:exodeoxyribonuclease V gamma subunit
VEQGARAGLAEPLTLEVVRGRLEAGLAAAGGAHRFLTGGVTFCNMVPMRSIPFRVVCLIGMNSGDFPRGQGPAGFDLMAQAPRRGDRSLRADDRYLFLEALVSARDCCYVSYQGRDERDDAEKIPAVLVSELLDYLVRAYRPALGGDLAKQLVRHHPLQPFSRRCFDGADPRLASYAEEWLQAARTPRGEALPTFADQPLEEPGPEADTLDLEELIRFLANPAKEFLTRRLGLRLAGEEEAPEDLEPFALSALEAYQVKQDLLQDLRRSPVGTRAGERLRAEGRLPHGLAGELELEVLDQAARAFAERLARCERPTLPALEVDLALGRYRLQGRLTQVGDTGLVRSRLGRLRAKDRLDLWVRHLVLNLLAPQGVPPESRLVTEDATLALAPAEDPGALLRDLLDLRRRGLQGPLPLFPECALAWAEGGGYDKVLKAWDNQRGHGDGLDAAVALAFRGREPFGPVFEAVAGQVFGPLLACASVTKAKDDGP